MQHYRYDHADPDEREPLDNPYHQTAYDPMHHPDPYGQMPAAEPYRAAQTSGRPAGPGAHPDSSFGRLRAERRYSRDQIHGGQAAAAAAAAAPTQAYRDPVSPIATGPQPPPHRDVDGRYWGQELGYPTAGGPPHHPQQQSNVTPGADNFGETAAGGMAGIAYSVAERNARESGLEAMRGAGRSPPQTRLPQPPSQAYGQPQPPPHGGYYAQDYSQGPYLTHGDRQSNSSITPLGAAAVAPAGRSPSRSPHSFGAPDVYTDDPYQGYTSRAADPTLGAVNPLDIEDDGDEGLEYRRPARTSVLSLHSDRGSNGAAARAGGAVAGGAAAGGVMGALGGMVGRQNAAATAGGTYNPVHPDNAAYSSSYDLGAEKPSDWLSQQKTGRKKWKWCIIIGVVLLVAGGIAGGVVGGLLSKKGSQTKSSADGSSSSSDLNIDSPEIKALLGNKNLHKVFPGVDYTPINTQYPDCIHNPPSQNNVTMDVAVLSQLTNTIRLYGTDCNQTQMVLHAIQQLKMEDTLKVWLGVWQDNNATTNARQLDQMWQILDQYGAKQFKGVIVANEILFRQQMTTTTLGSLLSSVRTNLTAKGMSLPVGTSDLGNSWTSALAAQSDFIMANIHPFFAGTNAKDAASWTYSFWENNNAPFFKSDNAMNIISETGWPSQGGTDCGSGSTLTTCPDAAVAGVEQMNRFMSDWVCAALTNGTQYFWFEAFDEPWKISFDTAGKEWEDHWGLMDVDRNLKSGISIPDCGGKTV